MSPQQRFSRFSTWIREQDPPDLPFSYFTQIGVLWAGECVFSISANLEVEKIDRQSDEIRVKPDSLSGGRRFKLSLVYV